MDDRSMINQSVFSRRRWSSLEDDEGGSGDDPGDLAIAVSAAACISAPEIAETVNEDDGEVPAELESRCRSNNGTPPLPTASILKSLRSKMSDLSTDEISRSAAVSATR